MSKNKWVTAFKDNLLNDGDLLLRSSFHSRPKRQMCLSWLKHSTHVDFVAHWPNGPWRILIGSLHSTDMIFQFQGQLHHQKKLKFRGTSETPSWHFFLIGRHVFISIDRRRCRASSYIQKVARKSRNVYLLHTSRFFSHLGATMQMTSCRCICLAPPERQSRRHKRGVAPTPDVTATRRLNVTDRRFFQSPSKQCFFLFLPSLLFKCFLQTSSQMDLWIKSNRSGKLTIWHVAALFICGFFWG